ncbi:MAG TPA: GntR family transcriptional regulator [Trebonia sp.]
MFLSIEPDGPVPIYQQIRDRIVEAIAGGRQPVGSGLPSTRQLAVDLGVNFHTVNKSYDLLRREGLLRLNRKSGAVVQRDAGSGPPSPDWAQDWAGRLETLLAEAAAQGMPADEIITHCRAAIAAFAFPADAEEHAPGHRTAIEGRP